MASLLKTTNVLKTCRFLTNISNTNLRTLPALRSQIKELFEKADHKRAFFNIRRVENAKSKVACLTLLLNLNVYSIST